MSKLDALVEAINEAGGIDELMAALQQRKQADNSSEIERRKALIEDYRSDIREIQTAIKTEIAAIEALGGTVKPMAASEDARLTASVPTMTAESLSTGALLTYGRAKGKLVSPDCWPKGSDERIAWYKGCGAAWWLLDPNHVESDKYIPNAVKTNSKLLKIYHLGRAAQLRRYKADGVAFVPKTS